MDHMTVRQHLWVTLARRATPLVRVRRYALAWRDHLLPRKTGYAQHGEDLAVVEQLQDYDVSGSIYIDVGANHPTVISNTYLLYRRGVRGIVVEPNLDLVRLHRLFRPGDVSFGAGCGSKAALGKLAVMAAGVLSTFCPPDNEAANQVVRYEYVPILPLDEIVAGSHFRHHWVCLLSVDTEGFDIEVLKGAVRTLSKTLLVCAEIDNAKDAHDIHAFLGDHGFRLIEEIGCNELFRNDRDDFAQSVMAESK